MYSLIVIIVLGTWIVQLNMTQITGIWKWKSLAIPTGSLFLLLSHCSQSISFLGIRQTRITLNSPDRKFLSFPRILSYRYGPCPLADPDKVTRFLEPGQNLQNWMKTYKILIFTRFFFTQNLVKNLSRSATVSGLGLFTCCAMIVPWTIYNLDYVKKYDSTFFI